MRSRELVLSCLFFFTTAICAGESINVQRGAQGLTAFPLRIVNGGARALSCQATTAHWYSVSLGVIAPGERLNVRLWKNVAGGEVIILNSRRDRMPVQRLWCGEEGRSWLTRSEVVLPTRGGERPRPISLDCAAADGPIRCRPYQVQPPHE